VADERAPQRGDAKHAPEGERDIPVRAILLGALVVYLILFAVLNSKTVKVSFVIFSTRVSLIVALVLAAVLGFFGGYLGQEMRDRRKRHAAKS
jgi:uncharacterized integral membrane protein